MMLLLLEGRYKSISATAWWGWRLLEIIVSPLHSPVLGHRTFCSGVGLGARFGVGELGRRATMRLGRG
jgi:hypothetical protein